MKKDFLRWHNKKEKVEKKEKRVFFHEREIWWCSLGVNVGLEQDGKGDNFSRPVLVFRKFNNEVFWGVPLTTSTKEGKFYVPIDLGDGELRKAILSQLRLIDAKRLYQKVATMNETTHKILEEALVQLCRGK